MANIQKKSFEKCSNNAKRIIQSTDRWIDGERLPVIVYDINPTVEEACEAIKFIIDTGWIGGIVYAKKNGLC